MPASGRSSPGTPSPQPPVRRPRATSVTTPRRQVVGSPTGFNKMRVSGPGIVGTCTNDDGSTVANCQETDKIIVQGKVQPGGSSAALSAGTLNFGDIAATPPVTKTLTYANTGSAPVTISSVGVS